MVYSDFFGKDSGGSPHYSDKKKWWFHVVASDGDMCDQNGKSSTL